jgi:spore coat protein U-like protein
MKKLSLSVIACSWAIASTALLSSNNAMAGSATASPKATATVSSVCNISAQNLNFGNLVLPLSAQNASTTMSVQCTNNSKYTVGLAYGGVYGTGTGSETATVIIGFASSLYAYNANTKDYQKITSLPAGYKNTTGAVSCMNTWGANGVTTAAGGNACYGYTTTGTAYTFGTAYGYGKMLGVVSGDNIAYFIQVPNNPAQVWNAGNYTYSATGNGSAQSIPVVGTLVPGQSGSPYPTPDMYMDTVTATVNF